MSSPESIFGADPDRVKRLLALGAEDQDIIEEPVSMPAVDLGSVMEKPGAIIGRYRLLRVLGEGGMGIVYLAEQERPVQRRVALKVVKPGMDSKQVLARFESEQQALALMEHPHVARVHDAGLTPSGRPFFVMEYVNGVLITEYCDKHRLTVEERLGLFLRVCSAVQHAHQKGIIHRDIKPSNILITTEGEEAVPKVIDFGVARAINQSLTERTLCTEQGQLIGTPEYMSPEQADPNNPGIDTRTDIYALGVLLYELLTGVLPFDPQVLRENGIEGARKLICEQEPQTPSTKLSRTSLEASTESAQRRRTNPILLQRRLRGDLDWITLKAMAKDRNRRYASAGELTADIQRHLQDESITAGRPSLAYQARKFMRRHRALVAGVATVLMVLLIGAIVSLNFALKAERAGQETAAVAEFLQNDVFRAMDASKQGGRQVTIKEILDAASQKVSDKFAKTPLHEAAIRKTLGGLYAQVTCFQDGQQHLLRSLEIFTRELGREDLRTIEVIDQLGRLYWGWWRYREAEQYLSEALPARRRLQGSDHPETVDTMAWLGWTYYALGYRTKAEEFLGEAYRTSQRIHGEQGAPTWDYMCKYGSVLLQRGKFAEAERLLRQALELPQAALDPFSGYYAASLGHLYSQQGRYQEAEELLSTMLAQVRESWGEHFGSTFHCVAVLAENYARQGLIDEAEGLLLDSLRRGERPDEPQSEVTVQTLPYLGFYYLWQRRFQEAERCVKEAMGATLDSLGEAHPISFMGMIALGMVYREQGRHDEAETQLALGVGFARQYFAQDSTHTTMGIHQLAALRQKQGRYAEAEDLFLEIHRIQRSLLVENHVHTLTTMKAFIALYAAWGKPQEARKRFEELKAACINESAQHQQTPLVTGSLHTDPEANTLTLTAPASDPWVMGDRVDFRFPKANPEMWLVCDHLHFAYRDLHGDGSVSARIEKLSPAHYGNQTGVMIRNTLGPDAKHASVIITPSGKIVFQTRTVELGAIKHSYSSIPNVEFPHWLRLSRQGNGFTAQHSSDGVHWQTIPFRDSSQGSSNEVIMNESVYAGLVVASGSPTHAAQAQISQVSVLDNVSSTNSLSLSTDITISTAQPDK